MTGPRVLWDPPASGAWNMAVDQMLLDRVDQGGAPVLRFYRWDQPTLSLGYFQTLAQRDEHPHSRNAPLVRRATGGGAILHDRELTYSLCVPLVNRGSGAVQAIYDAAHRSILASLADLGIQAGRYGDAPRRRASGARADGPEPFLCFQRRTDEDLVLCGYKIVGSAQRRGRQSVLQHGSILLGASEKAPQLPGVVELTSVALDSRELAHRIGAHLQRILGIAWSDEDSWPPEDARAEIDRIVRQRFGATQWTAKR